MVVPDFLFFSVSLIFLGNRKREIEQEDCGVPGRRVFEEQNVYRESDTDHIESSVDDLVKHGELKGDDTVDRGNVEDVAEVVECMGIHRGVKDVEARSDMGEAETRGVEGEDRPEVLRWEGFVGGIAVADCRRLADVGIVGCNSAWAWISDLVVVFSIVLLEKQSEYGDGCRN